MADKRYNLVLYGEISKGQNLENVEKNFATITKLDKERVKRLFAGPPVVIKREIDHDTAVKYMSVFKKAGAICKIEATDTIENLSLQETEEKAGPQDAAGSEMIVCPRCGRKQAKSTECIGCGIIFEKYKKVEGSITRMPDLPIQGSGQYRPENFTPSLEKVTTMGKFSRTWSLMRASWGILMKDKELLIFPFISGGCCFLVMLSFVIPQFIGVDLQNLVENPSKHGTFIQYIILFLFYFCNNFVIVFFNSAIIACAVIRMRGGDPTVSDGFRAAVEHLHLIAGWALLSGTVGLALRIIEDRSAMFGKIIAGLLGMAWTAISFLVVPVLIVENETPVNALKESTKLLKKTWGEQLISNFSFGFVMFALMIPAVLLLVFFISVGNITMIIISLGLAATYVTLVFLIGSALQAIFQAAIYMYARDAQVPAGFQLEHFSNAMGHR